MKLTGVLTATIFSSLSWITAGFIWAISVFALNAPEIFDTLPQSHLSDEERKEIEMIVESVEEAEEGLRREVRNGTIGFITSLITFIACLVKFPINKFLFPAIAAGSALIGAVLCGWSIMFFLLISLTGIGMVVLSHYLEIKHACLAR